jgi:hypothetical protein
MIRILLLILFIITMALYCSVNPVVSGDGGTTEITNAKITGQTFKTHMGGQLVPVPYAEVTLHSAVYENKIMISDENGYFLFDSVDTGRFWLEGDLNKNIAVVRAVDVLQGDSLVEISVLLKSMGGIRGQIDADTTGADPDSVYKTTSVNRVIPYFNNYTVFISNDIFPSVSGTFKVGVQDGRVTELDGSNTPPMFTHDASAMNDTAIVGTEYRDTVHAVDPDGDSLEFVLAHGPRHIELIDSIIIWNQVMQCCMGKPVNVSVQVQDNKGGYDILSWSIEVLDAYPSQRR